MPRDSRPPLLPCGQTWRRNPVARREAMARLGAALGVRRGRGVVTRIVDLHPDDAAARVALNRQLYTIRVQAGISRADLAAAAGTTRDAITSRENMKHPNPLIRTIQLQAGCLGHRLVMRPVLTPVLPEHPTVTALRAMADGDPDPDRADDYHRSVVLHTMVAHRRWLCTSARQLAERFVGRRGADCLSELENEHRPPQLSTYQRYARALGGRLELTLEPFTHP